MKTMSLKTMEHSSHPLLSILYQDEWCLIIDKPARVVAHPSAEAKGVLACTDLLREQTGITYHPVHRLDGATSGVLLFCRHTEDVSLFTDALKSSEAQKNYLTLVRGWLSLDKQTVERPVRDPLSQKRKMATTVVQGLQHFMLPPLGDSTYPLKISFAHATPLTGRRHQIRQHLCSLSHPLIGDTTYGKGAINRFFRSHLGLTRLFLHAADLSLVHPKTQEKLCIEAPLPLELRDTLTKLTEQTQ